MEKKAMTFDFDPYDDEGMLELMDKYGDSNVTFTGTNVKEQNVEFSIFKDKIVEVTYQSNGRVRENVYWRDGTREELYRGRWKR